MEYIIVDPQNDFITGKLGSERAKEVADRIALFIGSNINPDEDLIIVTQDYHHKNDPEFKKFGEHCLAGTEDVKIYEPIKKALNKFKGDKPEIIRKDIFGTNLDIEDFEVTLMGFCTDICILVNAILILQEYSDVAITVDSNLSCGTTEEKEREALSILKGLGVNII